jgi:aryl-alcohol dehydrogenase-like predicted oxidoreductase
MEQRPLGRSGFAVSRLVLGCGNFGGVGSAPAFFGRGETRDEAFELMDAARTLGITCLDTADAYGGGRSEHWVGEWLADRGRAGVVVATKVFHSVEGDAADRGLAPDRIRRQVAGSLERLGLDRIDLYLIHEPDPSTPILDTLRALDELLRSGTVGAIGASNVSGEQLEEALAASAEHGLARFEWVQNEYSLLERAAEQDVLPMCAEHGLGFTPFSPLAGGWLAGRYRRGEPPPKGSRMTMRPEPYLHLRSEAVYTGLEALERAAAERSVELPTLAFAWLLSNPQVDAVVLGPRRPEHLEPARAALELELSEADHAELAGVFDQ